MTHQEITHMAINEMRKWNLIAEGWNFAYHNKKRSLGTCNYRKRTIYFSNYWVKLGKDKILDTIRHEIAHALAGWSNGHNHVWRRYCIMVGANPSRCASEEILKDEQGFKVTVKKNFLYYCPNPTCDNKCEVFRRSKAKSRSACGKCCKKYNNGRFTEKYQFKCKKI